MSVFSRTSGEPEGTASPATPGPDGLRGTLRDCTHGRGRGRLGRGDIAVVDSPDMTRREAEMLIDAQPGAVVNIARFSTGSIPNYGPHLLLDAGIPLFENAGEALRSDVRDGRKGAVTPDGELLAGKKLVAQLSPVGRAGVDESFATAQRNLLDHMEAYFGNTIEFIHS